MRRMLASTRSVPQRLVDHFVGPAPSTKNTIRNTGVRDQATVVRNSGKGATSLGLRRAHRPHRTQSLKPSQTVSYARAMVSLLQRHACEARSCYSGILVPWVLEDAPVDSSRKRLGRSFPSCLRCRAKPARESRPTCVDETVIIDQLASAKRSLEACLRVDMHVPLLQSRPDRAVTVEPLPGDKFNRIACSIRVPVLPEALTQSWNSRRTRY